MWMLGCEGFISILPLLLLLLQSVLSVFVVNYSEPRKYILARITPTAACGVRRLSARVAHELFLPVLHDPCVQSAIQPLQAFYLGGGEVELRRRGTITTRGGGDCGRWVAASGGGLLLVGEQAVSQRGELQFVAV